jgi:hypothetical protein
MEYAWNMHGTCVEYARDMHGACMEYKWNMRGICMWYAWNTRGVCMEYAWNMHGICMEYAWDSLEALRKEPPPECLKTSRGRRMLQNVLRMPNECLTKSVWAALQMFCNFQCAWNMRGIRVASAWNMCRILTECIDRHVD